MIGERYFPARLELTIPEDLRWELKQDVKNIHNVVDPYNDMHNGVYAIGYDDNEEITDSANNVHWTVEVEMISLMGALVTTYSTEA